MENNLFLAGGEILTTDMSIEEIETKVNDKLDKYTGGLGRFTIKEFSPEKVEMNFWRDFILNQKSSVIYDMDMALITGIDICCFQLSPIGDPMIYPLLLDAKKARFYTYSQAFLRFYKNQLFMLSQQRIKELKIRIYIDKITFKIEF